MIPLGQSFIEGKNKACSHFCDTILLDNKKDFSFQFQDNGTEQFVENLDTNPFYKTNDLSTFLDIVPSSYPQPYPSPIAEWFILYSKTRCYFFHWGTGSLVTEVNETLTIVQIAWVGLLPQLEISTMNSINQTFGLETGNLATVSGAFVRIAINTPFYYYYQTLPLLESNPPTPKKLDTNNFYWNTGKGGMCFLNMSEITSNLGTTTPSIYFPILMENDKYLSIKYKITNEYDFDINYNFKVLDAGFSPIYTSATNVLTANSFVNINEFWKIAGGAPNGFISIEFQSVDLENLISDNLCIDNIAIKMHTKAKEVRAIDCNGLETVKTLNDSNTAENQLINISLAGMAGEYVFIIEDLDGNLIESIKYNIVDYVYGYECGNFLRLRWTDLCKVGKIDYSNLPFINEIMVYGYTSKAGIDSIEKISFVSNLGTKKKAYSHTISKIEVEINPYSEGIMDSMEVVFAHSILSIDLVSYYPTDLDFIVDEIGEGIYGGRTELYKSGSELIKSMCCC